MLEQYATERLPPLLRIRRWCSFSNRALPRLTVAPYAPKDFTAKVTRSTVGEFVVSETRTTPSVARGQGEYLKPCKAGTVALTLYKTGRVRVRQSGRDVEVAAGDVMLRDLRQAWEMDIQTQATIVSILLPAPILALQVGNLHQYFSVPLRAGCLKTSLLAGCIENLSQLIITTQVAPAPGAISDLVMGSARIAYGVHSGSGPSNSSPGPFSLFDRRLTDPAASIPALAAELGMSIRALQRLFADHGTTPRKYLVDRRLALAASKLREGGSERSGRVTEIALACGFNEASYFSRVFQQRFGMTPSQYARQANRAPAPGARDLQFR